jgi:predicted Zn-dependent protease
MKLSTKRLILFSLLLLILFQIVGPDPVAVGQSYASQAESLIRQAREQGISYLNSKDGRAKSSAKKNLEQAEKMAKDELKRVPACEKCMEALVAAYFYQAYFGFAKNYDECTRSAAQGLARFPSNSRMAFFSGYAHYNSHNYSEAVKALNRYLMSNAGDPQTQAQVRQLLQDGQQRFLTGWYRQANFYQSPESRIEVYNPQSYKKETVFAVTPQWELNLGGQAFSQLTARTSQVQDPELQTYLEQLVSQLASATPGPNFSYKVTVLNSPEVNAVTVPGHVFVYTGLLAFAESESQLAGVLSHELAHNYGHHAARRFIKAYTAQYLANTITQAFNPKGQLAQTLTQLGAQIGLDLFLRAYSRFEEKEADLYGSHIMFNAGYNPTSLSALFLKMYQHNPKQPAKFLSTHPPAPDRVDYLTNYLEGFPLDKEMRIDSAAFQKIKARLAPPTARPQPVSPGRGVLPPP